MGAVHAELVARRTGSLLARMMTSPSSVVKNVEDMGEVAGKLSRKDAEFVGIEILTFYISQKYLVHKERYLGRWDRNIGKRGQRNGEKIEQYNRTFITPGRNGSSSGLAQSRVLSSIPTPPNTVPEKLFQQLKILAGQLLSKVC